MAHHTKDKGDSGLGFIVADLMSKGYHIALPISEHLPFDCILISDGGNMARVSAKYRSAKAGAVEIHFRSCWADRHGVHTTRHGSSDYDILAVYCPETGKCYYLSSTILDKQKSVTLRVCSARNGQVKGVLLADAFQNPALAISPRIEPVF